MSARIMGVVAAIVLMASFSACITGDDEADPTFVIEPTATGETIVETPTVAVTATEFIACATTPPAELPPSQVGGFLFQYPEWYGGPDLWLSPAFAGANVGVSVEEPGLWYVGDTLVRTFGPDAPIEISGRLQDGVAVLEVVNQETIAPFAGSNAPEFTETIVRIPEPGCWELTAVSGEQTVELVLPVLPYEERPDVSILLAAHEQQLPYPAPATCAVTGWIGPEDRGNIDLNSVYWMGDDGIIAASVLGILWEGETNRIFWLTDDPLDSSTFELIGTNPERSGSTVRSSTNITNNLLESSVVFPGDGCWELTAETPTESATYTVYVYPATCKVDPVSGEIPESCEIP